MQKIFRNKYILLPSLRGRGRGRGFEWLGVGLCLLLLTSCKKEEIPQDKLAMQTAQVYYEQLIAGDVASFVSGMEVKDSVHPSYREQLETNMKMYLGQQEQEHKGIKSVKASKVSFETIGKDSVAAVLLNMTFGDNITEQVVVPMVQRNGIWLMK